MGCLIAAGVVVLIAGGSIGYLYHKYVDYGEAAGRVEADARVYRAAGLPWEAKDLRPVPVTPDQNAAPLILKASAMLGEKAFDKDNPAIQELLSENSIEEAALKLKRYAPALTLAEQAVKLPNLAFDRDWDMGTALDLSELANVQRLERAVCLQAQFDARLKKSDPERAVQELETGWKLSLLAGQDPCLINMLVEVSCQRMVLDAIQRIAASGMDDPSTSIRLDRILSNAEDLPNLAHALTGEAYVELSTVRNAAILDKTLEDEARGVSRTKIVTEGLVRTGLPDSTTQRAYAARDFEIWVQAKAAMDKSADNPEMLRKEIGRISDEMGEKTGLSYVFIMIMFPVYYNAATTVVEIKAETIATRGLLAAMQVRAQTGKWPARIEDIPGSWIDPFTGKPMLTKQTADSFRVYSVGPDLKDDGGVRKVEVTKWSTGQDYDIVASYPPKAIGRG